MRVRLAGVAAGSVVVGRRQHADRRLQGITRTIAGNAPNATHRGRVRHARDPSGRYDTVSRTARAPSGTTWPQTVLLPGSTSGRRRQGSYLARRMHSGMCCAAPTPNACRTHGTVVCGGLGALLEQKVSVAARDQGRLQRPALHAREGLLASAQEVECACGTEFYRRSEGTASRNSQAIKRSRFWCRVPRRVSQQRS